MPGKRKGLIEGRDPEQVASIRRQLREAHDQLKWAFFLGADGETAARMLHFCREADAAKVIKTGEG